MVDLTGFEEVYRTKNYGVYENPDTFENVLVFMSRVNPAKSQEVVRWKAPGTRNDGVVNVPVAFLGELKRSAEGREPAAAPRRRPGMLTDEQLAAALIRTAPPQWVPTPPTEHLRDVPIGYIPTEGTRTVNPITGDVRYTTEPAEPAPPDEPGF